MTKVSSRLGLEQAVMDLQSSQNSINIMSKLRKSNIFSNVLITLDDGTSFEAHKFLLARHSQFFTKLFTYKNTNEYHLGTVSSKSFSNILDWIYKVILNNNTWGILNTRTIQKLEFFVFGI
jgi:hypothetical protein